MSDDNTPTSVSPATVGPRPSAIDDRGGDDMVMPFAVRALDVRGRVVHLAATLDRILSRHAYPEPVARLLAEAIALTALLGSALKFDGRFILQTQTSGPVHLMVVDYQTPDRIRAYCGFEADEVEAAIKAGKTSQAELLGEGRLAMTVDQGPDMHRYQGIVVLDGESLEDAAHRYFDQSEQIPTRVRLAVAEMFTRGDGSGPRRGWRAGGFLIQFLPDSEERRRQRDLPGGDAPEGADDGLPHQDDNAWVEASTLAATIEPLELTDPSVTAERLLYRLFHEQGVEVFAPTAIRDECRCSRQRIAEMIRNFGEDDRAHMVKDGKIGVTCEFCSTAYEFEAAEVI
ncbi:MAG: Hsp33 family molecular chaperone [Hyphomicrobiaceae bacterium]|nr:Hsp33 family molecular chaperone [Hyphomicrobiaceae bacterium]